MSTPSKEPLKILVCGGREFEDYELAKNVISEAIKSKAIENADVEIVSGHCKGADMLGEKYATEHGTMLKIFKAEWSLYGRAAGPKRNKAMIDYISTSERKMVIAFVRKNSVGTRNTIKQAQKAGIEVIEIPYDS